MDTQIYIIGFLIILGMVIWITQFLSLLHTPKETFVYEENKIIWAVAIFVLGTLGAMLFWLFKPRQQVTQVAPSQEEFTCLNCSKTIPENTKLCSHCGWTY